MHETSGNIVNEPELARTGLDRPAPPQLPAPMTEIIRHQAQHPEVQQGTENTTTLPEITDLTLLPDPEELHTHVEEPPEWATQGVDRDNKESLMFSEPGLPEHKLRIQQVLEEVSWRDSSHQKRPPRTLHGGHLSSVATHMPS